MNRVFHYILMACFLSMSLTAQETVGLDVEKCLPPKILSVDIKTAPHDEYSCFLDITASAENATRFSVLVDDWDDNRTISYPCDMAEKISLRSFGIAYGNRALVGIRAINGCASADFDTWLFEVKEGKVNLDSIPGTMNVDLEPVPYDEEHYVVKVNASSLEATQFVVNVSDSKFGGSDQKFFYSEDSVSDVFSESIPYGRDVWIEVKAKNRHGSRAERTKLFVTKEETASLHSVNGIVRYAVYSLTTGSFIAEVSSETEALDIIKGRGFCALMLKDEAGNILSVKKMSVK